MFCQKCGAQLENEAKFCTACGQTPTAAPATQQAGAQQMGAPPAAGGQSIPGAGPGVGINGPVPPEILGFNFGALIWGWIWAFVHGLWLLGALCFIPYVNIAVMIYLGIKGNELAWKSRPFTGVQQFQETQRAWTRAAVILFVVMFGIVFLGIAAAIIIPSLL